MVIKNHLVNLSEILATASMVGIGLAIGGTIGASVVAAIGIELSGSILDNHLSKLKEKWLSSPDGILNHDIQQALVRAFIKALNSLEKKYFALEETKELPKEKREALKSLFRELEDEAQTVFLPSIEKAANEQEVKNYLYGDSQEAENALWNRIEGTKLIYTYYGEHFKNFLRDNCLDEIVFWFGEELKADSKESNKAWRAFQRMLLEGLQADVKAVRASQDVIQRDLQTLNVIREQLDQIKDTIDRRLPHEPFQESFAKALVDIKTALQDVAKAAQRIEGKQDIHIETTKVIAADVKKLLGEKMETEAPKIPHDIQAIIDEGWGLQELGKYEDAKAVFQKALDLAVEREHTFAVAEVKYHQATILIEFQGNPSAAKSLLQECLREYKNVNSDSGIAAVLRQLGLIEISNEDFDQAKSYTSQSLEIYRKIGKKAGIGDNLRQLGWIAHACGQLTQALDLYDQSLAYALELYQTGDSEKQKGEAQAIAACYAHKGMVYGAMGKVAEEEAALTKALEWQRKSNFKSETGKALFLLAQLKCREAQYVEGIEYLNEAGSLYKEIGDQVWLARCYDLLARLYFTTGEVDKATAFFEASLDAVEKSGDSKEQEIYLNKIGQLHLKSGKLNQAREYFEQAKNLSLRENLIDGYVSAIGCLAQIAEIENKKDERAKLLTNGIQALEKLLISTQREPKRASIIGQIGSFYARMENFQQALVYFQREKKIHESLSNLSGIANALGSIAWMKRELGQPNEEFDIYRELKKQVDGSAYYELIAGAANNLASFEMRHGNLNEAKRLLDEAEFYSRKYNLPYLSGIRRNQELLETEFKKVKAPGLDLKELITDLFDLINSYPESRDSLFRLWFFEKGADLYSNYRSMLGVKLMVCQDDVDIFLKASNIFIPYSELSLQVVSSEFPGTITEWFEYPAERGFPPIFSFGFLPKGTPKDAKPKINFSKLETRYLAIPTKPSHLHSKTTGKEGILVFGWSVGLPEQSHSLILSRNATELIEQKIFFLPYERHLANDELLSDLNFSNKIGLIPVYFDSLPSSENVAALHSAKINLPILSADEIESNRRQIRKIKHALTQLLSITKDFVQSALNNFVFEVDELSDSCEKSLAVQIQIYILEFPVALHKELHVAIVMKNCQTLD